MRKTFPSGDTALELQVRDTFASQSSSAAAYPPGNYGFAMHTLDDGDQFPVLTMPTPVYPNAPHISNFAAAQTIDPNDDFYLEYDPFSSGTNDDLVLVIIAETNGTPVFQWSSYWGDTKMPIPLGTLQPGRPYGAAIIFYKILSEDYTAYPDVFGATVAMTQTSFPIATISTGPLLSEPNKLSTTQFQFVLNGAAFQNYTIQRSTNLNSTNWTFLFVTNAPGNSFIIVDPSATNGRAFYRALIGP